MTDADVQRIAQRDTQAGLLPNGCDWRGPLRTSHLGIRPIVPRAEAGPPPCRAIADPLDR